MIGVPVLGILLFLRHDFRIPSREDAVPLLAGSFVLTAHFLVQITGIRFTSATNTGWIIASIPLVMAVLAFLILGERLGRKELAGVGIASCGIVLLVSRGNVGNLAWLRSIGDWLVLASCFTWSLFTILTRDLARRRDPLSVAFFLMIPTLVGMLAWTTATWEPDRWTGLPVEGWLALLFLGIFGTAAAHAFWQRGVAAVGASRAGIYLYLEPIATTLVAVPYLNESFGTFTGLGGGLVLAGVWWASRSGAGKVPAIPE